MKGEIFAKKYSRLLLGCIFPIPALAQQMSGTNYKLKTRAISAAGFVGGSSVYNLQDIVGINGASLAIGSSYALHSIFYEIINNFPSATVANYNDGQPIQDETPTLKWIYFDQDNDEQRK